MRPHHRLCSSVKVAVLAGMLCAATQGTAAAADIAIVGAKIYASATDRPIQNGVILIHDDRISAVGAAGTVRPPEGSLYIDGRGKIATAGLWNSHVHIFTHELLHADRIPAAELSATLREIFGRWGFTTVFDIASLLDNTNVIRERIRSGEVEGPTILTVGEPFYPPQGIPVYVRQFLQDEHIVLPEEMSTLDAIARERREIADGADGVKLFTGAIVGGDIGVLPMKLALAKALVMQAHKEGKPVFAHPSNRQGLEIAIDSGVDVLAHTAPMAGPWGLRLIHRMLEHRMALIPTLMLFEVEAKKFGESEQEEAADIATAVQQLHAYSVAGGEILFGTDVGYTSAFDPTEEYRLMQRAGLDYRAILATLTINPARRFGLAARKGRIAPGMDADLVLLEDDPAKDVTAFAHVAWTISRGKVIFGPSVQRR